MSIWGKEYLVGPDVQCTYTCTCTYTYTHYRSTCRASIHWRRYGPARMNMDPNHPRIQELYLLTITASTYSDSTIAGASEFLFTVRLQLRLKSAHEQKAWDRAYRSKWTDTTVWPYYLCLNTHRDSLGKRLSNTLILGSVLNVRLRLCFDLEETGPDFLFHKFRFWVRSRCLNSIL